MHREILKIGQFSIHSWGIMVALGFAIGMWYAIRRAKRMGFPVKDIYDVSIVVIVSAIVGSRIWFVITHLSEFSGNWLDIINPFQSGGFGISGMSMVGGVVAAIVSSLVFCLIRKINFFEIGDVTMPNFLLGMFIGRFGCFFNGCCFGVPTKLFWGVKFPAGSPAGSIFPNTYIHPTQLYEGSIDLIFFFIFLKLEKKYHSFTGWSMWMAFFLYCFGRVIVDYWRWYEPCERLFKYLGGGISVHGGIALALAVFSILMLLLRVGKPLKTSSKPE